MILITSMQYIMIVHFPRLHSREKYPYFTFPPTCIWQWILVICNHFLVISHFLRHWVARQTMTLHHGQANTWLT